MQRKNTTLSSHTRTVYTSPHGRVKIEYYGTADYGLIIDDFFNSAHRSKDIALVEAGLLLHDEMQRTAIETADQVAELAEAI